MFTLLENILEALYVYQVSIYFKLHLLVVILSILGVVWLYILEWRIKAKEEEPQPSKCSQKEDYFKYVIEKQKNTEEAVRLLQESSQYKQYLLEKSNPNSRFNRKDDDQDEIVLSDDSDELNSKQTKYD